MKGVTAGDWYAMGNYGISILTPVKGVTTESVPGTAVVYISILTPMKGVTPWSWPHLPLSLFQFSPP